jgi:uncharacterized protein (TIGR01777 family)
MNPVLEARRVVVAGGSGFLGLSLAGHLSALGAKVTILSRKPPPEPGPWTHVAWDARTAGDWVAHLEGADGLINLAGRSVDCVKTPDHCDEILRSRVEATQALGAALRDLRSPPGVWIQMSTAHIYGDPPEVVCDEDSPPGFGLAPFVGRAWEEAFREAAPPGMRQVILRTSFVLGRRGGALTRLAALARRGLGGTVGHGRQGVSWIHQLDMNRLFERALTDPAMRGVYVATAPNPVSNAQFMRQLRRVAGGLGSMGVGLPAFAWMVRLGAPILLGTDPELALFGRTVVSRRLREEGFAFRFPALREALGDLFSNAGAAA